MPPIRTIKHAITTPMLMLVFVAGGSSCKRDDSTDRSRRPLPADGAWFVDISQQTGLDFVHTTGSSGEYYFPEIAGSGCALFDYDGDGDLDVYAMQAHPLDPRLATNRGDAPAGMNRLFRNDLQPIGQGRFAPKFVDVTRQSGVGDTGYGMGCTVGDYDNDGDLDLFVTNFGPNVLYRNNGDGTFENVTTSAISAYNRWSTSASFFDYDKDGFLDLFVTDYVSFHPAENRKCHSRSSRRDYCGPSAFEPVSDHLFHNEGDGTFTDVTVESGIDRTFGSGLGVVCADFNGDTYPDIYVANDGNANQLWINKRDGTFANNALLGGAAYNAEGIAEAGMGVTAGDFDTDGDLDIFLAHLVGEHNTLLVNTGDGLFDDRTDSAMLGAMSRSQTAFGTRWFDFDGDGDLDLFLANGAVKIAEECAHLDYPYPYPNQLVRNSGPPAFTFEDVSDRAGSAITLAEVSRGAAFGDVDNDGDPDILVSNSNGPLRLLRNDVGDAQSWLRLRLIGSTSNRDGVGSVIRLTRPNVADLIRRVHADGSYCSANDLRVRFGLGHAAGPHSVTVAWPSGKNERFDNLAADVLVTLREGQGTQQ
jgi:enediyne biosynthesis protein E4